MAITDFFSGVFESVTAVPKKMFGLPTKVIKTAAVDAPMTIGKVTKAFAYDAPKKLHGKALWITLGAGALVAALSGIGSGLKRSRIENSQEAEASDLQASIAANRAARVETSAEMGQSGTLPYRDDWGKRMKGGLPGLPPTV